MRSFPDEVYSVSFMKARGFLAFGTFFLYGILPPKTHVNEYTLSLLNGFSCMAKRKDEKQEAERVSDVECFCILISINALFNCLPGKLLV